MIWGWGVRWYTVENELIVAGAPPALAQPGTSDNESAQMEEEEIGAYSSNVAFNGLTTSSSSR